MRYFRKLSDTELQELRDKALRISTDESIADLGARMKSANLAGLCDEEIKRREEKDANS